MTPMRACFCEAGEIEELVKMRFGGEGFVTTLSNWIFMTGYLNDILLSNRHLSFLKRTVSLTGWSIRINLAMNVHIIRS